MIRTVCMLVAIAALAPSIAHANSNGWRDGCPAGHGRTNYTPDPRLGAPAEAESALTQSRVLLGVDGSYHTSHGSLPRTTTWDGSGHLQLQAYRGLTLGVTWSYLYHLEGSALPTRARWFGPVTGSIGWRWNLEGESEGERISLRRALAVQVIGGDGSSDLPNLGAYRLEAALRPFDGYLLASSVVGGMAEYRIELVGCWAAFVHFRGGGLVTGIIGAPSVASSGTVIEEPAITLPGTMALGAYVSDHAALIGEYGLAFQRPFHEGNYVSTQRLRVVIDLGYDWGNVGGHIDFTTHVDGVVAGLYAALNL